MLFKDCLCFQIGKVSRKMAKVTRDAVSPYGLTTTQFFLLTALYEEEDISISALAQKVVLDKATLTGLVDRLERDGFVTRQVSPEDRRSIRVRLTPKAERLRETLTELYHRINRRFLSFLTEEERKTFEQVVSKIENAELGKGEQTKMNP
ncbi:MAG: MarR family transcriptional regulator [Deltaproteobacteria bacterium]|nr:MAG: MarR family transcriptional regulator [Deltaproteobacteria bacterium]